MQNLRQYVENYIDIDDKQWQIFAALFKEEYIEAKEEIYVAGEISTHFSYLSKGVVRTYMLTADGNEHTWVVHAHTTEEKRDYFIGDYSSYLSRTESDFFSETLTPCRLYTARFDDLNRLYESDFIWMKLGKCIAEEQWQVAITRKKMLKQLTAKERYQLINQVAPIYQESLTNYQYASVLGITPQSLSRIKNG